jgi:alanyl-tRNA synthetase
LEVEASQLAEGVGAGEPYRVVRRVWERREPGELRALAQELARLPRVVALLGSVGERADLCFSRAEDVELDVAKLIREACEQLGGRGGGRSHLAQGSAPVTDPFLVEGLLEKLSSTVESAES